MNPTPLEAEIAAPGPALQVYLLGCVDFDAALALQRRLAFRVSEDRNHAALILCEHPSLITVGRQGSWAHIEAPADDLRRRGWRVRWVNRGGGCQVHLPGQLAIYPILPLDRLGLGLSAYLDRLQCSLIALLQEFRIEAAMSPDSAVLCVGDRPIAGLGVAVRDWVSYYGAVLNVNPDLAAFRLLRAEDRMTSIVRERRDPLRPALVRERFLEHFTAQFSFARTSLFFEHPFLRRKAASDALATSS